MMKNTLLLVSGFTFAYAANSKYGNIFGASNDTALMGDNNFTLRINVAESIPDWNTTVKNPRVVTSFYALEWSGNTSLNDTIAGVGFLGDDQAPRICASVPMGLLATVVNNGYDEKYDGDCTGALGKDCVNDLKQTSYDLGASCPPNIPKSCDTKLGTDTGTLGSAPLVAQGETQMSPFDFLHWLSPPYNAGDNQTYIRETERLHVVIFAGKNTYPVCLRVKTDHVSETSPASGAATISSRDLTWAMLTAIIVTVWLA